MEYLPTYRPPSEALSLILPATVGCSWNKCAFCDMYRDRRFRPRPEEDLFSEIEEYAHFDNTVSKVFLGDGNALALSSGRLLRILKKLNEEFPKIRRISAYAAPKDILQKSPDVLASLREAGLALLYVGVESGSGSVLNLMNKNETYETIEEGLLKAKGAGIKLSVMIINGLGGKRYTLEHAKKSADVVNATQPEFLSTLVLSFPIGLEHFKARLKEDFEPLPVDGLLLELREFISALELKSTVFRSDHASNYLPLKGILPREKKRLLADLDFALKNPGSAGLRSEFMRGL